MPKRNLTPDAPIDYRATFAQIRDRAEPYVLALRMLMIEADEHRDDLMALHPEVERWSTEQNLLERLYGYDQLDGLIDALDAFAPD